MEGLCSGWQKFEVFLKKWANPGLFFIYFRSFQTNNTIFTTNQCEKCPSSTWHWDSNPRPFDMSRHTWPLHRPGLSPKFSNLLIKNPCKPTPQSFQQQQWPPFPESKRTAPFRERRGLARLRWRCPEVRSVNPPSTRSTQRKRSTVSSHFSRSKVNRSFFCC